MSDDTTAGYGKSQAPGRREDARLLTGRGRFTDDYTADGQLHAVFLRSPMGHAEIRAIDTTAAAAAPGVRGIFTSRDLESLGPLPCLNAPVNRNGDGPINPPRHALATDRVRHVGDAIALVVADSLAQALDASERIELDLDPLPAITDVAKAMDADAPVIWPEAPNNVAMEWDSGDADAVAAAFARADHVVRLRTDNNRLAVCAMEPRAALAEYDDESGRFTLHAGTQGVNAMRDVLATHILKVDPQNLRVVSGNVGGGFGMKTQPYPEYAVLLFAARQLRRPVKWVATRSESFLSDNQARDGVLDGALALDADGRFLALQVAARTSMGAYLSSSGVGIATRNMAWCLAGVYQTPAIHVDVKCLFTNTTPTGPYRGAGRPEASFILERLVDQAAAELGIDRIDLRRRNLIRPTAMPYATPVEQTYDSGAFETILDQTLELADWRGFAARREGSARRGALRGLGIACFIEHAGARLAESARIAVAPDGTINVFSAAQSQGQGHMTSFAQVVAERLGLDPGTVRILEGDSDLSPTGGATTGSRSMAVCGGAMLTACDKVVENGRAMAAHVLETAVEDIVYDSGQFTVTGTDRSIGLFDLAKRAETETWPEATPDSLDVNADYEAAAPTYPNGCHICEVEVDRDTGAVTLARYAGIDDVGRIINPMIVDGQMHGGIVQGAGQVLSEFCRYDAAGQLLSGSFMDYTLPRAADYPAFVLDFHTVPCTTNALGVKGAGESGTIGAIPAVANAIADALRGLGIESFDMPATSERIWRLLQSAR